MTEPTGRPKDAAEFEMLTDADGHALFLITPDDAEQPLSIGVIDSELFNIVEPLFVLPLWSDQAIELGQALIRAGVRKEVIGELPWGTPGRPAMMTADR